MANNGDSHTYKLFREYFYKDRLIPILESDNEMELLLKNKINSFISKHGYNFKSRNYTAEMYRQKKNLIININQIRMKYWNFAPLKIK